MSWVSSDRPSKIQHDMLWHEDWGDTCNIDVWFQQAYTLLQINIDPENHPFLVETNPTWQGLCWFTGG